MAPASDLAFALPRGAQPVPVIESSAMLWLFYVACAASILLALISWLMSHVDLL
jgi:hypothetical protein